MGVDYANVFVKNLREYQYYLPLDDVHVAEHDVSDEAVHVEVLHLRPLEGAMLDVEGHDVCRGMEEEPVAVVHILVTAHDLVHAMAEYLRVGVDYQVLVTMVGFRAANLRMKQSDAPSINSNPPSDEVSGASKPTRIPLSVNGDSTENKYFLGSTGLLLYLCIY